MATLDDLQAVLGWTADKDARERISNKLDSPESPLVLFLEGVRRQGDKFTACTDSFDGTATEWAEIEAAWENAARRFDLRSHIFRWSSYCLAYICAAIAASASTLRLLEAVVDTAFGKIAAAIVAFVLLVHLVRRWWRGPLPHGTLVEAIVGSTFAGAIGCLCATPYLLLHFSGYWDAELPYDVPALAGFSVGAWIGADRGLGLRDKLLIQPRAMYHILTGLVFSVLANSGGWIALWLFFESLGANEPLPLLGYIAFVLILDSWDVITDAGFPVATFRQLSVATVISAATGCLAGLIIAFPMWLDGYNFFSWFCISLAAFSWLGISTCCNHGLRESLVEVGWLARMMMSIGGSTVITIAFLTGSVALTQHVSPDSPIHVSVVVAVLLIFGVSIVGLWIGLPLLARRLRLVRRLTQLAATDDEAAKKRSGDRGLFRGLLPIGVVSQLAQEFRFAFVDLWNEAMFYPRDHSVVTD